MNLIDMALERILILSDEIQKLNKELKIEGSIENIEVSLDITKRLNEIKDWSKALLVDEEEE